MRADDMRRAPRFSLRLSGGAGAYTAGSERSGTLHCEMLDVSAGGLKGRLLTGGRLLEPLSAGQQVELMSFASPQFNFMLGLTGEIAWINNLSRQFGIRFHQELDPDDVETLIFHFSGLFGRSSAPDTE